VLGTLEDHVDPALPGETHRRELVDPGAHVEENKVSVGDFGAITGD